MPANIINTVHMVDNGVTIIIAKNFGTTVAYQWEYMDAMNESYITVASTVVNKDIAIRDYWTAHDVIAAYLDATTSITDTARSEAASALVAHAN